jgi:hypothetical protein
MNKQVKPIKPKTPPLAEMIEGLRGRRILKPKDIMKVHSRLIMDFIAGDAKGEFARDIVLFVFISNSTL